MIKINDEVMINSKAAKKNNGRLGRVIGFCNGVYKSNICTVKFNDNHKANYFCTSLTKPFEKDEKVYYKDEEVTVIGYCLDREIAVMANNGKILELRTTDVKRKEN